MKTGVFAVMLFALTACGGSGVTPPPEHPLALPSAEDVGMEWQPIADRLGPPNISSELAKDSEYRNTYRAARCDAGWCVAREGEAWIPYSIDVQHGRITRATPHAPVTVRFTNASSQPVRVELGTEYNPGEYGPPPAMGYGVLRQRMEPGEEAVSTFYLVPGYSLTVHLLGTSFPDMQVVVDHWDGFFVTDVDVGHSITFVHAGARVAITSPSGE